MPSNNSNHNIKKYLILAFAIVFLAIIMGYILLGSLNKKESSLDTNTNTQESVEKISKSITLTFQETAESFSGDSLFTYDYVFQVQEGSTIERGIQQEENSIQGEDFTFDFKPTFEGTQSPEDKNTKAYEISNKYDTNSTIYALIDPTQPSEYKQVTYAGTYLKDDPNCAEIAEYNNQTNYDCAIYVVGLDKGLFEMSCSAKVDMETALKVCNSIVENMKVTVSKEKTTLQKVSKSIGIKFWKQDPDYTVILSFKLDEKYELTNTIWGGQPSAKVTLDNGELLTTIAHMALPIQYKSQMELVNTETEQTFYRVEFADGTIAYVDEMITTGECPHAPVEIHPPCGTPTYDGLNIECSSSLTIEECDEVMMTLIVKDVK